jgi:putative transposase
VYVRSDIRASAEPERERRGRLSVWWLRLGIQIERKQAGASAGRRAARADAFDLESGGDQARRPNVPLQQARFDTFITQYNQERPRQALGMPVPADLYTRSARVYRGLEDLTYPLHEHTITVTHCGRVVCFKRQKVNRSRVFAGQNVGVRQVGERIWLVTFMQYDLGYFDDETCRLEPIDNPFRPKKVLPMSSE